MRRQRHRDRRVWRILGKGVGLAVVLVLALACQPEGEEEQERAREPAAQELLDATYLKYIPLGNGLSCRMDQFAENHGAVGYRGTVKNESSTGYLDVILIFSGYDESGKLLAAMDLSVGRVAASDVARFESMLQANYWKFAKFSVELKSVTPEDGT